MSDPVRAVLPLEAVLSAEQLAVLRHEVSRRTRAHERAMAQTKRCPGCGQDKALTEWGVNAGRRDGLQTHCVPCMAKVRRGERVTPEETSLPQAAPLD